jgi:hypothetical protein
VGIQAFQQRLGECRIVVVEALVDARTEQRDRLDQARDAGVVIAFARDVQVAGRLRKAGAELACIVAEQSQLFLEIT